MRETFSTLLQTSRDFSIDDKTSSTNGLTDSQTFLARQINATITYLYNQIKNYKTQPLPRTMSTVADQIYYHYPPSLISLQSVTMTIGDVRHPLKPIESQQVWDFYQQLDIASSDVPQFYFPRQYDFGIWPTPSAVRTVTVVGNYLPTRLSVTDYTTGTVSVSQNSATITGSSTVFTAAMVGRWFCEADSSGLAVGNWYKITSFSSTTSIALESVFEESALSGSKYIIAQSPEIPEELHEYIPYRVASIYYSTIRRDAKRAQELLNFFYTGDFGNNNRGGGIKGGVLGVINEYKNKGRSNSSITEMHKVPDNNWSTVWGTTLNEAA